MGAIYWTGLGAVAILLGFEHTLVRPGDLKRVNLAFFWVNITVGVGLWLVISLQLWLG
jgi:4-hydroxybenzoate polyprenyltransferase